MNLEDIKRYQADTYFILRYLRFYLKKHDNNMYYLFIFKMILIIFILTTSKIDLKNMQHH